MLSGTLNTIRRLIALMTATAGLAQGITQYESVNGTAQFPAYAALTVESSFYGEDCYIGDNAVVLVERHSSTDGALISAYTLAEIYVPDVRSIRTYYSDDPEIGLGAGADMQTMSTHVHAALAVNGDFYDILSGKTVVRDSVKLASFVNSYDLCVLYEDGSMRTYDHRDLRSGNALDAAVQDAWQVWSFGPALLESDGSIIEDFTDIVPEYIRQRHPRTCIGYYGPGHYCLLAVSGYLDGMPGVTLEELSQFFSDLGCTQAYNLDGGVSTHIWFNGREIGYPTGQYITDLIYLEDTVS